MVIAKRGNALTVQTVRVSKVRRKSVFSVPGKSKPGQKSWARGNGMKGWPEWTADQRTVCPQAILSRAGAIRCLKLRGDPRSQSWGKERKGTKVCFTSVLFP